MVCSRAPRRAGAEGPAPRRARRWRCVEPKSVLVTSTDPLAAALLGALVELEGYTPHFLREREGPRAALRRVRPAVVLIDCDSAEARSASVIGPAKMLGTRVALFGRPAIAALVERCAAEFGVAILAVPPAPGELRRALAAPA